MIERRLEFILRVSLICLLRIPEELEEQVDGDGFPGTSPSPTQPVLIFFFSRMSTIITDSCVM